MVATLKINEQDTTIPKNVVPSSKELRPPHYQALNHGVVVPPSEDSDLVYQLTPATLLSTTCPQLSSLTFQAHPRPPTDTDLARGREDVGFRNHQAANASLPALLRALLAAVPHGGRRLKI